MTETLGFFGLGVLLTFLVSVVAAEAVEAALVVEEEEDPVPMAVVVAEWELEPVSLSTPSVFVLGSGEKGAQICTYHLY